jgi:hypothetical protein
MACGCRKNRNNQLSKAETAKKVNLSTPNSSSALSRFATPSPTTPSPTTPLSIVTDKKLREKKLAHKRIVMKKYSFCRVCHHSLQTREERKDRTRICHKSNIPIQSILNNKTFICPIKKF